jgi:putative phosphoribosyl transferase
MNAVRQMVRVAPLGLEAVLDVPPGARGLVVFAHGSGSGRLSPRNRHVADALVGGGCATLLADLLTPSEAHDRSLVFNIDLLAARLLDAAAWTRAHADTATLPLGLYGASTGAAAALRAAAAPELASDVRAVVSRGGRVDLAGADALAALRVPTLFVVGSLDATVLTLNRTVQRALHGETELAVIPGAGHLFEEPGALDAVARLALGWFDRFFPRGAP